MVKAVLAACGTRKDCRLWSNNTGKARALTHDGLIKFGLKGSADLIGITSDGRFLALEVKTGKARQELAQLSFENMIRLHGGRYQVVRTAEEARHYLDSLQLPPIKPY